MSGTYLMQAACHQKQYNIKDMAHRASLHLVLNSSPNKRRSAMMKTVHLILRILNYVKFMFNVYDLNVHSLYIFNCVCLYVKCIFY